MLKLIKYEIETVWKDLLVVLAVVILLNLALITRINVWKNESVFGLSCLIFFGGLVAVFISNIRMFTRDLKEGTGYLIFTLPQSGYSILGEKLIVSLIEIIIISIVGIGFVGFFSRLVSIKIFSDLMSMGSILQTIVNLFEYASLIMGIYFSVAITKVIMRGRRLTGLVEVAIFAALSFVSYKIDMFLRELFPQQINAAGAITNFQFSTDKVSNISYGNTSYNIASGVLDIIIAVVLFVITARILEKKIDL